MTWAHGDYYTIRGRVACHWQLEGGQLKLQATVPPNTTATIRVPTTDASKITENGQPARPAQVTPDDAVFEVGSGTYDFVAPYDQH